MLLPAWERADSLPPWRMWANPWNVTPTSLLLPKWLFRVFLPNTGDVCPKRYM